MTGRSGRFFDGAAGSQGVNSGQRSQRAPGKEQEESHRLSALDFSGVGNGVPNAERECGANEDVNE